MAVIGCPLTKVGAGKSTLIKMLVSMAEAGLDLRKSEQFLSPVGLSKTIDHLLLGMCICTSILEPLMMSYPCCMLIAKSKWR